MNSIDTNGLAQALFEEAGDALFLCAPEGDQLLDVNLMAERLSGYARAELLQLPASYLFRYAGQGGLQRLRDACHQTLPFHSQEGFFLRTPHDKVWIPVNLTVARLHVRPRTLALITARDVREQHETQAQLQQAATRLRLILDSAHEAFVGMDPDGAISDWNNQAEATFGWSRAEAVGRAVADTIIPPQYRAAHRNGLARFLATGEGPLLNRRLEITALHRDGREFPVEMTI